jgi:hypothetical protein
MVTVPIGEDSQEAQPMPQNNDHDQQEEEHNEKEEEGSNKTAVKLVYSIHSFFYLL